VQLDELAFAGLEHLDAGYVETYDRKAGFDPGEDLALLREYGLDSDATLVDLGAGTGTFALAAASECALVVAVDVSPAMVALLRAKVDAAGLANVRCVEAGFLGYEHDGAPADFAYSRNALHHLPDFWKAIALRRVAGMLRRGGILRLRDLVYGFEPEQAEASISAWLDAAAENADHGWTRKELETHLRDEHSTFSWLLEPMIEHTGFEIERRAHDPLGIYGEYVCRRL
jgi:SAM-dependent methyltransferase